MGWCDDSNSKYYNKRIKFPFKLSAEKLWLKENIYDLIIVINYNLMMWMKCVFQIDTRQNSKNISLNKCH